MKKLPLICLLLASSLLFLACQPEPPEPTVFSSTAVVELTETETPSPSPTFTQIPTLTPTLVPPTGTSTPTSTPLPCPPFPLDMDLPDPDIPENYVGRHYDMHNLPEGLEDGGGSIIREKNGIQELAISNFAWQQNRKLYWLEKLVCRAQMRQGVGRAYFEILDAIASPSLSGDERYPWVCFQNDEEVDYVIALGYVDEETPLVTIGDYTGWLYTKIVFAFRIDFETEKLMLLEPENLVCLEDRGR